MRTANDGQKHSILALLRMMWSLDRTAVLIALLYGCPGAAEVYLSARLAGYATDGMAARTPVGELLPTVLLLTVGIAALEFLPTAAYSGYMARIEPGGVRFAGRVAERTLTMDYEQLDSPAAADLRRRMETDNQWGAGIYNAYYQLPRIASSVWKIAASCVALSPLFASGASARVFSLYFAALLACMAGLLALQKRISSRELTILGESNRYGKVFSHFVFGGIDYKLGKDIRLFGADTLIRAECEESRREQLEWMKRISPVMGLQNGIGGLTAGLTTGGAYWIVVLAALQKAITVGGMMQCAAAVLNFTTALSHLLLQATMFGVTARRQASTLAYLDVPDGMRKGTLTVEKRATDDAASDRDYELEFRRVSFRYPGSDAYALRDMNLKLRVGQKLAVVGRNGSGKTTMIKLLCRLYDPTEGEILLNGIDIRSYRPDEYRALFSVVFQDFRLFAFTLAENIAASDEPDRALVVKSLERVDFSHPMMTADTALYKSMYDDGVEISGGEAQKIALARAMYKTGRDDPSLPPAAFMILDEPTAALDPIAEAGVYAHFDDLCYAENAEHPLTAIFISHRLSSCRFCDDIAVFSQGRLVQRGSHDTLVAIPGEYAALWQAQAQYYASLPQERDGSVD